ncbi:hypothetical protein L9F63_016278, partial [Diploptera punctata]
RFHSNIALSTTLYETKIKLLQTIYSKLASVPVHRGSLSEMRKHLQQNPYTSVTQQKSSNIIQVNIKQKEEDNLVKEQKREKDSELSNNENGLHQNIDTTKNHQQQNGTSRAGSLETEDVVVSPPKPKPRTTTTATSTPQPTSVIPTVTSVNPAAPITGGYKPRLGPKPFTPPKLNFSSSGVFSVPVAPGHETRNGVRHGNSSLSIDNENGFLQNPTYFETDQEGKTDENKPEKLIEDGSNVSTPSTAERRKLYEKRISSGIPDTEAQIASEDADDKLEDFERASVQRTSIAERRRVYENKSVSVQEPVGGDKRSPTLSPTPLRRRDSFKGNKGSGGDTSDGKKPPVAMQRQASQESKAQPMPEKKPEPVTTPTPKRTSTVFGRVSKFRHLKGTPLHKSTHIENVRNISRQISGECDGFHANPERVAVPLSGPGGKIAVFELSKTGKLPDGVIPTLVHGTNIMDFAWDPFNCKRLAVACDDGMIRLWLIPEEGLAEPTNEPHKVLAGHSEKIYFIKFHPLAEDVLASGSYDMTIRIWDLATEEEKLFWKDILISCELTLVVIMMMMIMFQMFSFSWSPCGVYCATACKDSKLRVYKPRSSTQPIREGKGPIGSRGARVVWALEGRFIVVMGFDKVSERQIQVFKADNLNSVLNTVGLDVSPAILIPFYDEDSSTLFLTGKGDTTIYAFEVTEEAPYICPLSHHRCNTLHQGLSFLPKSICDVGNVEFARALRLTNNTIEPLSFTVPRIKSDLFQDDLFPPTKVTWKPTMTSNQWFQGLDRQPARLNLKPEGMESLSEAQGAPAPGTADKQDSTGSTKEKQEQIQRAVSSRMEVNMKLEQDEMEGVDDREWED